MIKQIKIPTEINDITLGEFQNYSKHDLENSDEDFVNFKTIEAFTDLNVLEVSKMDYNEVVDISAEINAVLNQEHKFESIVTVNEVDYGFIPELEKMSIGEYIDLEKGLSDIKDYHKAIAVLYRPIKKRYKNLYTVEDYNPSLEAFDKAKQMPLGVVTAAVVFFYNIVNELQRDFQTSSKIQKLIKDSQEKSSLLRNSVGLALFTR